MPGRKKHLESEIIPNWVKFLRGLLQGPTARKLLATRLIVNHEPLSIEKYQRALRTTLSGVNQMSSVDSKVYPTAEKVWEIARGLRGMGHYFCAGPLALYAASYLSNFVSVMVLAEIAPGEKEILLQVIDQLIESCEAVPEKVDPISGLEIAPKNLHLSIFDPNIILLRSIWFDHTFESHLKFEDLFDQAWEKTKANIELPEDNDLDAAILAASNELASLSKRKKLIIIYLRRYFKRLDLAEFKRELRVRKKKDRER